MIQSMSVNPFLSIANNGEPIVELKTGLVLYLEDPPGPMQARRVYELYQKLCGDRIRNYCSTAPGSLPQPWNPGVRQRFESHELPDLRKRRHWGYGFDDGNQVDSWLFMFHGYRPHSEAGKASFYRFDFPWDVDLGLLRTFADDLISFVPCLSGFGGYYFQGSATDLVASYDLIFAWAHRYWGIEAHNLDRTVAHMLDGYKCVNWLTIIGNKYRQAYPAAIDAAKKVAFASKETNYTILFQAESKPQFGDINRREVLTGYASVARALLPLQINEHQSLGGTKWTAENTIRYIRRFTGP